MTSISNNPAIRTQQYSRQSTVGAVPNAEAEIEAQRTNADGDTVEISEEARSLLEADKAGETWKPFTFMDPEAVLVAGSKEETEFRELLKSVKSQKSDIMSRIQDILKENNFSLGDLGKIKVEVKNNGKIVVGGLRDAKAAKAIEEALNRDKSLGKALKQFQHDEEELNKQIKKYTGCSLYELTMTAQGDINKRVRDTVESQMGSPPRDEFYWGLYFLGETTSVVNLDDVTALGFGGMIDFSGELTTMAEPEQNIKESMGELGRKIQEEFDAVNNEIIEKMKAAGVEIDEDFKDKYLLDLTKAKITVDSLGGVNIEGMFAGGSETHKRGESIVRNLVSFMLNDYDANSYHRSVFVDASEHLLKQTAEESGLDGDSARDSKVEAELAFGSVGEVRVSSPKAEQNLTGQIEDTVNKMIANSGIAVSERITIEIDDSGKITATNLKEGTEEAERVQALLDKLNGELEDAKPENGASEKRDGEDGVESWADGVERISDLLGKLGKWRGSRE